ncbi:hypothetical protein N7468_010763 [Penicillium chermesinum]|uniref:3-beta hydroxysteroid dehydrogenase/isomerase domain-containing protein n=1 Tax=Penicillium chermesinum TaxID=63820 RepID=A0A9W9N890_9EURO|nr:uncharacterized protein N7468_010763 [Penicillium chermesinum]KAJ5215084.1 hypothetical protein N7468_010763 [Penicillium chermesinum]
MALLVPAVLLGLLVYYLRHVNQTMKAVPEEVNRASPHRWTEDEIERAYKKSIDDPVNVVKSLPPKQSRRYIVAQGWLGGWIVSHLLARGEHPSSIRILDLLAPTAEILAQGVGYVQTNITDETAVDAAFAQSWPAPATHYPLTVFHTAAIIRPQDRLKSFLHLLSKVNVDGTRNVLDAARKSGASCFISTSSGSVSLHQPNFFVAPWKSEPERMTQVLSDDAKLPKRHEEFFGNYAVTKIEAERLVRAADDPASNFRTGCIRPANGIYGIGSDAAMSITGNYLRQGGSPTWVRPIVHSFVNAENVSIAHLLYEQRLVEQSQPGTTAPDIGGQAFVVTDPNPAIAFGDIYTLLGKLSKTPVSFPTVEPILMLLLGYVIEFYSFIQHAYLPWLLPKITGDLAQVQPALFAITDVHVLADDTRARLPPHKGGLGYNPPLTTLDGMCKQLLDWNQKAGGDPSPVEQHPGPLMLTESGFDVKTVPPANKI